MPLNSVQLTIVCYLSAAFVSSPSRLLFVYLAGVLPVNYHGKEMPNTHIPADALNVFTIANVKEGSPK
jgi:hypothetical protein